MTPFRSAFLISWLLRFFPLSSEQHRKQVALLPEASLLAPMLLRAPRTPLYRKQNRLKHCLTAPISSRPNAKSECTEIRQAGRGERRRLCR